MAAAAWRISRWYGSPANPPLETASMLQAALPLTLLFIVASLFYFRPTAAKAPARHRAGRRR